MMKPKTGVMLGTMMTLGLTVVVYAAEYNFYEQADKAGCASIITCSGSR